ncbi:DUF3105 domain-containing protein [Dactylosporangium sp. AC04546]|uniref:DUF3105 domain-containing protein n=1 Tax=Dactylosporangium sp. AC04546 TaxID=2862460 RepID=UPI001EDE8E2D|nr:DUF3105 domain-containing protein [Dactylosporangium sp. AC04546]WVK85887.1 DUF3105 domain-containing protein [Dactylosporangium sp. AC04546]
MTGQYPPPPYQAPCQGPAPAGGKDRRVVIAVATVAGVLALMCVAGIAGVFWLLRDDGPLLPGSSGDDAIPGVIDYRTEHPEWLSQDHRPQDEQIDYPMTPPAGGPHHQVWQQCKGDIYAEPIGSGNAVHSLEHGAVWITYQPSLSPAEVEKLADRVRGNDYLLMSPFPGQSSPVSLQAWGYQLRVSSADDDRIDDFIRKYRQTASMEPGAACSTGSTATGNG